MYSEKDIQQIRDRVNLVDLVSQYTNLKRSGKSFRGLCPFHLEKTPSFYVDPQKQLYHCFGCGAGGDIFDFVMETEKLSFNEAVEYLAGLAGVTLTRVAGARKTDEKEAIYKALERAKELYQIYLLKSEEGKKAIEYLKGRNVSLSSIKEFEIGLSPNAFNAITKRLLKEGFKEKHLVEAGLTLRTSRGLEDRFKGRIMFPIKDLRGRVVGFGGRQFLSGEPKYLNTPETTLFKKSSLLFNLSKAKKFITEADSVIIVEGYTDVIALNQAGIPNVVATLGTALTETHLSIISRFTKNVFLCFDSDTAGQKAAERGVELIPKAGRLNIKVIIIPGEKDPADFVASFGETRAKEEFLKFMSQAELLEDFVLKRRLNYFDLTNPKDKRQALETASEIIALIEDEILREEFIKKYANILFTSDDTLRKVVSKKLWYNIKGIKQEGLNQNEISRDLNEAEARFFNLLYADYEARVKKAIKELKPEHFFDDILKLLFSGIIQNPKSYSSINRLIEKVRLEAGEEGVKRISQIFLQKIPFGEDDERIFEETIVYLKKRLLEKEIFQLKLKIQEAEKRGDFELAQSLLKEVQEMVKTLNKKET